MAGLAVLSAQGSLHALAATTISVSSSVAATAIAGAPLQIDGETVAIAALGTVAALALLYFAVKFAAGFREYLQVRRRDAAGGENEVDRENGGRENGDPANGDRKRDDDTR